jgi:hypothetical protein
MTIPLRVTYSKMRYIIQEIGSIGYLRRFYYCRKIIRNVCGCHFKHWNKSRDNGRRGAVSIILLSLRIKFHIRVRQVSVINCTVFLNDFEPLKLPLFCRYIAEIDLKNNTASYLLLAILSQLCIIMYTITTPSVVPYLYVLRTFVYACKQAIILEFRFGNILYTFSNNPTIELMDIFRVAIFRKILTIE